MFKAASQTAHTECFQGEQQYLEISCRPAYEAAEIFYLEA